MARRSGDARETVMTDVSKKSSSYQEDERMPNR